MNYLLLALLLLTSTLTRAETLYLGALSHHLLPRGPTENVHALLGLEKNNVAFIYFNNSFGEDTFMLGKRSRFEVFDVNLDVLTGVSYGYRNCLRGRTNSYEQRRLCMVIAPLLSVKLANSLRIYPTFAILGNAVIVTVSVDLR